MVQRAAGFNGANAKHKEEESKNEEEEEEEEEKSGNSWPEAAEVTG